MGDPNTGEIYEGALRKASDVALTEAEAVELGDLATADRIQRLKEMMANEKRPEISPGPQEANPQPDLRTLEGALDFLDYHSPDPQARAAHEIVNKNFQTLVANVWQNVPAGPGKTVWLRKMNEARMAANAAIATHGA